MDKGGDDTKPAKKSFLARMTPEWARLAWRSPRQWKHWTRGMVALFAAIILMIAQNSLNVLGQAAFFGLILGMILPPIMPTSLFLLATATLVFGMLFGWAWGCAAMASGLRARDQVLLASEVETERAGYNSNANLDLQYQQSIFRGAFLDPATSAVIGVFFFFGTYALGYLRAAKPKLALFCLFGTIIMDVQCSFAPLFPIAQYTLPRQILLPSAAYVAIALVVMLIIFPESLSHQFLDSLVDNSLKTTLSILTLQDSVLRASIHDLEGWSKLADEARRLRKDHVESTMELQGQLGLLKVEVTRGRLGPKEVGKVFEKSREVGVKAYGLASFVMVVEVRQQRAAERDNDTPLVSKRMNALEAHRSAKPHTTLTALLGILDSASSDLRNSTKAALEGYTAYLHAVNSCRWSRLPLTLPPVNEREAMLATLTQALSDFRTSGQFALLDPFRSYFSERDGGMIKATLDEARLASGDLYLAQLFATTLIGYAEAVRGFCEYLLELEKQSDKQGGNNMWWPGMKGFVSGVVEEGGTEGGGGNPLAMDGGRVEGHDASEDGRSEAASTLVGDGAQDEQQDAKKGRKTKGGRIYPLDPDAAAPGNAFHRFGRGLSNLWHRHLTGRNGIFALKYGLISIALWVPAVCRSSAYFTYTNRGLWALIMAQMGLGVFTGEQIVSFVVRMGGTIVGLVLGMLAWYIGAARGPGSPYGVTAATMVIVAPFLWLRIAAPQKSMALWLMIGVTILFIVGYSWVDEHIYQTANQGSGAGLAGRRALLVMIGFAAAFLIMLFPRPISARKTVRFGIARVIRESGDLYGDAIRALASADGSVRSTGSKDSGEGVVGKDDKMREKMLKILARLQELETQIAFASMEPSIKGKWPKSTYTSLLKSSSQIVAALALLMSTAQRMDLKWNRLLVQRVAVLHPAFVGDSLVLFATLSNALRTGTSLPPSMPIFERLVYHQEGSARSGMLPPKNGDRAEAANQDAITQQIEGEVIDAVAGGLTWETAHDEQLALFATCTVALLQIAGSLEAIQRQVKALVGEGKGLQELVLAGKQDGGV